MWEEKLVMMKDYLFINEGMRGVLDMLAMI